VIDTKSRILDTAERLIGERGYSATSLRHIISEAGVNLAAIHYHFGSKEELLDELIERKAGPVNAERLTLLDQLGESPTVEKVLEAFLLPMAEAADRNPQFVRLMGRVLSEGMKQTIMERHFQTVSRRFFGALRRTLPGLSDEEFQWRMQFMIGAMAHTMCGQPELPESFHNRIRRLVIFLAGGFQMEESK
jgi:AcrR family transcriptional regulator